MATMLPDTAGDDLGIHLPVSTLAMVLLLGPAAALWLVVEALVLLRGHKYTETVLTFLRCTTILSAVLFLCYYCEHAFYAPKAQKTFMPAMYWGLFALLLVVSCFSVRKCHTSDFMNREQTEEWKGWMQFLFIQYHYWKMEAAYKDIRVYITCYLWMTGFGNLAFFYTKRDFSLLRVLQMVWRMNFFVFFLCMTMDNAYIVYYICPLHTFFFLVTYVTMAAWSSLNHTQYGAAFKVVTCAIVFWLGYDMVPEVFHPLFCWLGDESTHAPIGGHGVEWEWYFRSFLDHFSTVWGMVFALNMPFLAAWFQRVESFSAIREWGIKISMVAVMAVLFVLWAHWVYSRDKFDYNAIHAYYGIVPLLSYLMLRNISKTVRGYYLHILHWYGTITLECYLLQYHIWLSGNAAKLLNVVPGQWLLTFILASAFHVFCASQVFSVTNKLRDICLPNSLGQSLRNLALLLAAVLVSWGVAAAFIQYKVRALHLVWLVLGLACLALACLEVASRDKQDKRSLLVRSLSFAPSSFHMQLCYFAASVALLVGLNSLMRRDRWQRHHPLLQPQIALAEAGRSVGVRDSADDGEAASWLSGYDFPESVEMGRLWGFVIGSLAQPRHGLVATLAVALCILVGDSYFGFARLFLFLWAPEGHKIMSYDEVYGPLLRKLGVLPQAVDAEAGPIATEQTPLMGGHAGKPS